MSMMVANTSVIPFAIIMGISLLPIPYNNQSKVPEANNAYIPSEMPEVFLVWMVLMAWGIKEMVVQVAAIKPRMVIRLI